MSRTKRKRPTKDKPRSMSPAQRERAVAELHARLDLGTLACRGMCHDSCGAIGYSLAEARVIAFHDGSPPMANGFHSGGFHQRDDIMCDKLTPDKRCSIYDHRPLICRVYGMAKAIPCAHGCQPTEWLDDNVIVELLLKLDALEGKHGPSHQIAAMVSAAAKLQGVHPSDF